MRSSTRQSIILFSCSLLFCGCQNLSSKNHDSFENQSKLFRAIREEKGKFQGGDWNIDLDTWGGKKHKLMQMLAKMSLEKGGDEKEIRLKLGPPDQILNAERVRAITKSKEANKGLVYYWRAKHDYLVFIFLNEQLTSTYWHYTQE